MGIVLTWFLFWDKKIKVSVIVPVYNTEMYLEKCLSSLKNQTLKEIEFIVINDGSTDSSFKIMQKYAKEDKRFRIYSKENEGVGKTRNLGIELSKGEYIGFVDSDDFVSINYFEELYKVAKRMDAEISVTPNVYMIENGKSKKIPRPIDGYKNKELIDDFSFLISDAGEQWDKIYKKSFLDDNKIRCLEDRVWFEDVWFSTLVAIYAKKIVVAKDGEYNCLLREGSISEFWDISEKYLFKGLELYRDFFVVVKDLDVDENRRFHLRVKLREKMYMFVAIFKETFDSSESVKNRVNEYIFGLESLVS
jgi:glycosyltransferase involved in cell wall biosynthesis